MDNGRRQILLSMHSFYANGSNHQLTMMWETVKWFTPVLTVVAGGLVKYLLDGFLICKNTNQAIIIIICSFGGILLSIIANLLLKRFYAVNMRYVTMYAKVEEELDFDKRQITEKKYYPVDNFITWEGYVEHRNGRRFRESGSPITSKYIVDNQVNLDTFGFTKKFPFVISKDASIFNYMKLVFYLFIAFFAFLVFFVLLIWL